MRTGTNGSTATFFRVGSSATILTTSTATKLQSEEQRPPHSVLIAFVRARLVELKEVAHGTTHDGDSQDAGHDHHSAQNLDNKGGPLDD
ncbi:MAG TPA: hypothetical protein VHE81_14460 [Lacipirellulaceae bacterium]|nr:hypothetical protein [Lacipirellulaceae bacterium]